MTSAYSVAKRVVDIGGAASLLALLGPVALAFALAIRLRSAGSFLYVQTREGQYGRPFSVFKLRTMHEDATARLRRHLVADRQSAEEFAANGCLRLDPRIVGRVGAFARQYSIDEIPQLWNVLVGDMSLVGPRPLHPDDAKVFFDAAIRTARLQVPPGLTGLWQVKRSGKKDVTRNIAELDLLYVKQRSLRLDLMILAQTPRAVLSGGGLF
jgi:lipopolysaccharide/colanic/teichoic acid biosynthesis glycosyltransferase